MLTVDEWHRRFTRQAVWTDQVRQYLYQKTVLSSATNILEVGCGTGVITFDLHRQTQARVYGLDLRLDFLHLAHTSDPATSYLLADGLKLPLPAAFFDVVICHYLLLWIHNPLSLLDEMKRVTRSGGCIVALAEPDYGGRIDHPAPLVALGHLQAQALIEQGADPETGRKLKQYFIQAGLMQVEAGLLGGQWSSPPSQQALESEWSVLRSDLAALLSPYELSQMQGLDEVAWQRGERILFVPTFYALGYAP